MFFDQASYTTRFEWGIDGLRALLPTAQAVVVVDVLRFTTAVDVAVGRGAVVYPYRWKDASVTAFAASVGAEVGPAGGASLSPAALASVEAGRRIVLPSPNGATIAAVSADAGATVFAGCLRNASAVARAARACGSVTVIAAGERWSADRDSGGLRPSLEDLLGAGAVLAALDDRSPEAEAAVAAFMAMRDRLPAVLRGCSGGRELIEMGFVADIDLAAELDRSDGVPQLIDGAFRRL